MAPNEHSGTDILCFIVESHGGRSHKSGRHGEGKRENEHYSSPIVMAVTEACRLGSAAHLSWSVPAVEPPSSQISPLALKFYRLPVEAWFRNMLKKRETSRYGKG